jgi:hypothetical protein
MRCLNAASITAGAQAYVQNAFAALTEELDDKDDDVQTVITQMAAFTTQSQLLSATMAAEMTASEVQSKMIIMGHQISSCHVPVVKSFFIL